MKRVKGVVSLGRGFTQVLKVTRQSVDKGLGGFTVQNMSPGTEHGFFWQDGAGKGPRAV